jgi:prepilin-type N-terminal cleavage/methylation domain-containing protein
MKRIDVQEQGFTLLEAVVVIGIIAVLMGAAMFGSATVLPQYRANTAQDLIVSALRQARFAAITQRRNVQVWISQTPSAPDQTQSINYQVLPAGTEQPSPPVSLFLPQGTQFVVEPDLPDTPMAFGNSAPVYIGNLPGGPLVMMFQPTGAFTDQNNAILNGTIFLGMSAQPATARAVTIMGGIGAINHYSWNGTQWQ